MDNLQLIRSFQENQTLANLQDIKNAGLKIEQLKNNKWQEVSEFTLPFKNTVPLYLKDEKGNFNIVALGIY